MLVSFSVKNCLSIVDTKVDFSFAEGKAPNGYRQSAEHIFLQEPQRKERLVSCLALYGANASGKTNILLAINIFAQILFSGIENKYFPNKFHPDLTGTTLELVFLKNRHRYRYCLEYDASSIRKEELHQDDKLVFSIENLIPRLESIATPHYTNEHLLNIFDVECRETIDEKNYQRRTFLAILKKNYSGLSEAATESANYIKSLLVIMDNKYINLPYAMDKFSTVMDSNEILKEVIALIKKLDIEIMDISLEEVNPEQHKFVEKIEAFLDTLSLKLPEDIIRRHLTNTYTFHRDAADNMIRFNVKEESAGTQILIDLLPTLLLALGSGLPIIIDELDNSLHPFIVRFIVKLFKDKTYNPNNAQLIFTTHTTDILDGESLRPSEVAMVNKTLKKGSQLRRIVDFDGIRNVHNFRKAYISGMLSGIPYPYL